MFAHPGVGSNHEVSGHPRAEDASGRGELG